MTTGNFNSWNEANQQYLMAALRVVQVELELFDKRLLKDKPVDLEFEQKATEAKTLLDNLAEELPALSALDSLVKIFGLSSFERKILLLCAGVELDSDFADLIANLQGNSAQALPSFSLAMAAFSDAHWSALSPNGPLRYWRMIELTNHQLITKRPVRIDEQLLHFITGLNSTDERFSGIVEPVIPNQLLVPSHQVLIDKIIQSCTSKVQDSLPLPLIQLKGDDADVKVIASYTSNSFSKELYAISAFSIPVNKSELTELLRLLNRESAIHGYAFLIDCAELDTTDKLRTLSLNHFIDNFHGLLFLSTDHWSPKTNRQNIILDVLKPTRLEQSTLWQASLSLNANQLNGELDKLVSQFNMSAKTISDVATELREDGKQNIDRDTNEYKKELWKLCIKHSSPDVNELAHRIEPAASWDDIVLPEAQKDILREIAIQVKHRKKVYDDWGFAGTGSRGLGISAMFTGESGTGKTMAAEVLANELNLDLYRIDLSQVVNKYIGETEKNLKRIFDAAEGGGAILLFDEADALFGKRSEVKDSHDRYGNIEVSYLLQRMEAYRGLAILTTNMKNSLDKAFLRRIRFVVQFPFPGIAQRIEIWGKVFPYNTPTDNLDLEKLAKFSLPGGNIRNIAMNAAFIAADENLPVGMSQILRAAKSEYNKLEKAMNNIEIENI